MKYRIGMEFRNKPPYNTTSWTIESLSFGGAVRFRVRKSIGGDWFECNVTDLDNYLREGILEHTNKETVTLPEELFTL